MRIRQRQVGSTRGIRQHRQNEVKERYVGGTDENTVPRCPSRSDDVHANDAGRDGECAKLCELSNPVLSGLKALQIKGFRLPFNFRTSKVGSKVRQV
jgi:hypothetical protein